MAKNRYNKPAPVQYQPAKKKVEEVVLQFSPCCVCGKEILEGFYGRWGEGGVCSKHCNILKTQMPLNFGEPHGNKIPSS